MIYRKLDPLDDFSFGQNANDFYAGTQAVAQAIYTSLRLLQGEFWEDISQGLPLFQHILGQSGTPEHLHAADALVQEQILNVQGVTEITSFSSSYVNRSYTVSYTVQSQYGTVVAKEVTFG